MKTEVTVILIIAAVLIVIGIIVLMQNRAKPPTKEPMMTVVTPDPITPSVDPEAPSIRPTLVLFHSLSCPHCTHFMGAWTTLKQQAPQLGFGTMEFEGKQIDASFGVKGVPTIRFYPEGFAQGKPHVDYTGPRSAEAIIAWLKQGQKR
jgi:thioredoxin-like negative regulator of GroEL